MSPRVIINVILIVYIMYSFIIYTSTLCVFFDCAFSLDYAGLPVPLVAGRIVWRWSRTSCTVRPGGWDCRQRGSCGNGKSSAQLHAQQCQPMACNNLTLDLPEDRRVAGRQRQGRPAIKHRRREAQKCMHASGSADSRAHSMTWCTMNADARHARPRTSREQETAVPPRFSVSGSAVSRARSKRSQRTKSHARCAPTRTRPVAESSRYLAVSSSVGTRACMRTSCSTNPLVLSDPDPPLFPLCLQPRHSLTISRKGLL